jgi:uncharacterized protein YecT (DUF1311 family)
MSLARILLLVTLATSLDGTRLAQTQADMTQGACAQYKKADQTLNNTYAKILKDNS